MSALEGKQGWQEEERVALFVGRICAYKNVDKIIEGFLNFEATNSGWILKIVGPFEDESYASTLLAMVDKKDAASKVIFCGFQSGESLQKLYASASLFINASDSENFGMSIAEALSFASPA